MIVTFLATTQLPLQDAIFLGAGLSLIRFCVQLQRRARLVQPTRDPTTIGRRRRRQRDPGRPGLVRGPRAGDRRW